MHFQFIFCRFCYLCIYVQVNLKSLWDTHLGSFHFTHCSQSVFVVLQKHGYLIQTLIYWKAIFVLEPIIEMFLANLMTCCKIFVCLITDYNLKKPFIILGYLTIVIFVILFCCWKIEDIHFLLCLHWGLNIKTQSMIKLHFRCPITFNLKVCDIINKGINSDSIWHITSKMCNAQSDFFPVSGRGC